MAISSLRRFWRQLSGAVHPADAPIFDSHPGHTFNLSFPPPAFVGDIDNAPIVVLMANGGYKQGQTEAEFSDQASVDLFRSWLHGDIKNIPPRLGRYYTAGPFNKWIESGKAVIVNAVPYRSPRLSEEPFNRLVATKLPSCAASLKWLNDELLPAAMSGQRFVLVHRNGWWQVPKHFAARTIVFSDRVAESNRSSPDRDRVDRAQQWLDMGSPRPNTVHREPNIEADRTRIADPDDRVFTFVRPAADTEKRRGTAGYERYDLIEEGMTVREFMEKHRLRPFDPPRRVDVTYNLKPRPGQRNPNLELGEPDAPKAIAAREARKNRVAI
ncbi:MAG: hypothetical protein ABSC95_17185 [Acetobacteraceae bacterium]|jgi:hypothetical protein